MATTWPLNRVGARGRPQTICFQLPWRETVVVLPTVLATTRRRRRTDTLRHAATGHGRRWWRRGRSATSFRQRLSGSIDVRLRGARRERAIARLHHRRVISATTGRVKKKALPLPAVLS